MIAYVLAGNNDTYVRLDSYSGKYVKTKGEKYAKQFPDRNKAENVLKSCVSKEIKKNFRVKEIVVEDPKPKIGTPEPVKPEITLSIPKPEEQMPYTATQIVKTEDIIGSIAGKRIEDDQIEDWLSKVDSFIGLTTDIELRFTELSNKLSEEEKKVVDIYHYIEFADKINACQGYKIFKALQTILRQRRKYKDELDTLNLIRECNINSSAVSQLHSRINLIASHERIYNPRILEELFQNEKTAE